MFVYLTSSQCIPGADVKGFAHATSFIESMIPLLTFFGFRVLLRESMYREYSALKHSTTLILLAGGRATNFVGPAS